MTAAGLAPGTVHTRVQNVRAVLRGAVRDRVISSDPTDRVPLPRRRRREQAMTVPTPRQVGALLAAADDRFTAFIAVCAFGGLRLGEAAALQVGDVDFLRRRLLVSRQVQRGPGGAEELRPPSTAPSAGSSSPTGCSIPSPPTSSSTWLPAVPNAGFSRRAPALRRTRTPSATSGGRRPPRPASAASGRTTSGTSSRPASSRPGATSSRFSARSGTPRRPRP
jgi:hypothetical protein